jgi:flagellar biosynthesis protein FlhF
MSARAYRAATLGEAMAAVKRDLGSEAMVLKTRTVRRGGLLGLGGRRMVEIVAAGEPVAGVEGSYVAQGTAGWGHQEAPALGRQVAGQLEDLRAMVRTLVAARDTDASPPQPRRLEAYYNLLVSQEVAPELADEVVAQLERLVGRGDKEGPEAPGLLTDLLAQRIRTDGQGLVRSGAGPAVIMLIGPTGVGKTTTIAKLAARYKLTERRRVALITLDTYRIAAVDQLQTYAGIIGLPLRTVLSAPQLQEAIVELRDCDVVLIDTAGRSQHNDQQLHRLGEFIQAARPDQVHLVLSATANPSTQRSVAAHFGPLGADRLILTKLDEAGAFGAVLNIARTCALPLSYVTTGQEVPDDIEPAEARALAQRIVGGTHGH